MAQLYSAEGGGAHWGPPPGRRGISRLSVALVVVLVLGGGLVWFLDHAHTANQSGSRDQQTMLALYSKYGITQPAQHPTFDTSPDTVSRGVRFQRGDTAEICTVRTGPVPGDVSADCRPAVP